MSTRANCVDAIASIESAISSRLAREYFTFMPHYDTIADTDSRKLDRSPSGRANAIFNSPRYGVQVNGRDNFVLRVNHPDEWALQLLRCVSHSVKQCTVCSSGWPS